MKMRLVKESLNEFGKGNNPMTTLGLGYKASIIKFFENLGYITNKDKYGNKFYTIEDDNTIIVNGDLNIYMGLMLFKIKLLIDTMFELPDNLIIKGDLVLTTVPIKKLPNNLTVEGILYLNYTNITELPNDLECYEISIDKQKQQDLYIWIENSKFKYKIQKYI